MKKLFVLCLILFIVALPAIAAKRVVVLNKQINGTTVCYNVVNWFAITSGIQTQANGSVWTGASAGENAAIQAGTVAEESSALCFPVAQDTTSIKAVLVQQWTNRNGQINGIGPAQYNGVFFDSTTGWSQ